MEALLDHDFCHWLLNYFSESYIWPLKERLSFELKEDRKFVNECFFNLASFQRLLRRRRHFWRPSLSTMTSPMPTPTSLRRFPASTSSFSPTPSGAASSSGRSAGRSAQLTSEPEVAASRPVSEDRAWRWPICSARVWVNKSWPKLWSTR